MKRLILLVTLLFATPALAQTDVVYTPTSGTFAVKAQAGVSDQDSFDTASIGIRLTDGSTLACADAGPGQVVTIPVTVPISALPVVVHAVAFANLSCAGLESASSPNSGTLTLKPPPAPELI